MSFFKKLFNRGPEDYLAKGDGYFAAHNYYESRSAFEAGLLACQGKGEHAAIAQKLEIRISETNRAMAELNIQEAEHALRCGAVDKAIEHLELAKALTDDTNIREKADHLLIGLAEKPHDTEEVAPAASCSSCSGSHLDVREGSHETEIDLPVLEHYDLLIHQLPEEMYTRYAALGEKFAYTFIAASRDSHQEALKLLEQWFEGSDRDIYCYEKGKILHRLGRIIESEACMRESIGDNSNNPLPHLGLALLLIDDHRLDEAASQLDTMISNEIFTGQALMMKGEVFQLAGDTDAAIHLYSKLLDTSLARAAGEKLYGLLLECDRKPEAAHIFKRYLSKCQH
jgi:predicted negative regulator of RcsB-dependent stress response